MHSHPYQNVMRTVSTFHISEVDHQTVTMSQRQNSKEREYSWTNHPLPTASQYYKKWRTAENQPFKHANPPPINVTGVQNISPLIQLLEQIAKDQYEIKAFADNHVNVQPKTSGCYGTTVKALAERHAEFHTYKLKEERWYRVLLKNMHSSINLEDINIKIKKLRHKVTNIWNIKQYRTKSPLTIFFVDLKPAPNNKHIFNA
jgi:hypothetical protein